MRIESERVISHSSFGQPVQVHHLPVVVAALQTLDSVIAGGRTVWTAAIKIAAALAQARYGCGGNKDKE